MVTGIAKAESLNPFRVEEVRTHDNWPKWKSVIMVELQSLHDVRTWDVVECPEGANIVGCKWVFKIKKNAAREIDKYKM